MKRKVTVTIADRPYTLVTTEEEQYVQQVAGQVDELMSSVIRQARVPALDAAVLTAVNAMDSALKEREAAQALRGQIKDCLEDANRAKQELADARREIRRLKKAAGKEN